MKKVRTSLLTTTAVLVFGGAAYAADLPTKGPVVAPIPYVSTWQGGYIGGHLGVGNLNVNGTQTFSSEGGGYGTCTGQSGEQGLNSCSTSELGFLAGVQAGYDWQNRSFVYGVVADWTWTDANKTVTNSATSLPYFRAKVDWLASFRGRMGMTVDDTLLYLTGGVAIGHLKSGAGQAGGCPTYCYFNDLSDTKVGWVAGGGVEHRFGRNWSIFAEALYYNFPNTSVTSSTLDATYTYTTEFQHSMTVARMGVNWRW